MNENSTEIRVALILPKKRKLITRNTERPALFVGERQAHETAEASAHRIIADVSDELTLALPRLKTYLALEAVNGIVGFSLAPSDENSIDLRQFRLRGSDYDALLDHIELKPDYFDQSDIQFIGQAIKRHPRT